MMMFLITAAFIFAILMWIGAIIVGLAYIGMNFDSTSQKNWHRELGQRVQAPAKKLYSLREERCYKAIQQASWKTGQERRDLHLKDIGLLTYKTASAKPEMLREITLMPDVRFIRPFIEITGYKNRSSHIMLEILDGRGRRVYAEGCNRLIQGKQVILPQTWLALDKVDDERVREWAFRVHIDGQLFAETSLGWHEEAVVSPLLSAVGEDGEIGDQLHELLQEAEFNPLSLDDLLDD